MPDFNAGLSPKTYVFERACVYLITPSGWPEADLLDYIKCCLAAGVRCVQLREKTRKGQARAALATEFVALCKSYGAASIINDDVDLAQQCGAAGVHLGIDDGTIGAARAVLGQNAIIGASCYNRVALAEQAVAQGADYIAFGAVFASATKPAAVQAPLGLFRQARSLGVPMVAIGGITKDNAAQVYAAGAHSCAVITDIAQLYNSDDLAASQLNIRAAINEFQHAYLTHKPMQ